MTDLIVSIAREVQNRVLEDLKERGPGFGWFYAGSLSDRLPDTRSQIVLRDQAYTFHRVRVEEDRDDAEIVRIALRYDPARTGQVLAERNLRFSYSGIGLPFTKGGKHASYLSKMEVAQAHLDGVDGSGVRVAVIDSGQDAAYGSVKDYYDVENAKTALHPGPPIPVDNDGHGTAMSTLVREIAKGAEIYIVRISDQSQPLLWNLLAGVAVAAYDCNAEILSLSVGYSAIQGCACGAIGATRSLALKKMLNAITQRPEFRIYVTATGNEFSNTRFNDPAGFDDAVAVGSVNDNDYRSQYSNYGTTNHPYYVLAPGGEEHPVKTVTEDVGTCGKAPAPVNPCYGTSVAAAYASGLLALLRSDSRHQNQTRDEFLRDLKTYCRLPAHVTPANAAEYGKGILRYVAKSLPNSEGDAGQTTAESGEAVDFGDALLKLLLEPKWKKR
jgi:subtilisin family serine protease